MKGKEKKEKIVQQKIVQQKIEEIQKGAAKVAAGGDMLSGRAFAEIAWGFKKLSPRDPNLREIVARALAKAREHAPYYLYGWGVVHTLRWLKNYLFLKEHL